MDLTDAAKRAFSLQDYSPAPAIDGVEVAELKRFTDDGGSFMELGRLSGGLHAAFPGFEVKQINYSEMEPGAIKAFHLHQRQTDVWFVPPGDKLLLVLLDLREGSGTRDVLRRMVLGDGLKVTVAGAAVGMLLGLVMGQFATPILFGVNPRDPATLLIVTGTVLAVSILAIAVPASRAMRLDPARTLRGD